MKKGDIFLLQNATYIMILKTPSTYHRRRFIYVKTLSDFCYNQSYITDYVLDYSKKVTKKDWYKAIRRYNRIRVDYGRG